jgi:hypothetical protein
VRYPGNPMTGQEGTYEPTSQWGNPIHTQGYQPVPTGNVGYNAPPGASEGVHTVPQWIQYSGASQPVAVNTRGHGAREPVKSLPFYAQEPQGPPQASGSSSENRGLTTPTSEEQVPLPSSPNSTTLRPHQVFMPLVGGRRRRSEDEKSSSGPSEGGASSGRVFSPPPGYGPA